MELLNDIFIINFFNNINFISKQVNKIQKIPLKFVFILFFFIK